jgi:hypothetical protein
MDFKDVVIGQKVVPHTKTGDGCKFSESSEWAIGKSQGFLYVVANKGHGDFSLSNSVIGCGGDWFNASDFEPYIEKTVKQKFGGFIQGNKAVIYFNGNKGEANYNPNDAKDGMPFNAPYGLLLAYCRATNTPIDTVDILFKKPEKVKEPIAEPVTFEVGEMVRIRADLIEDEDYGIYGDSCCGHLANGLKGKTSKIVGEYTIRDGKVACWKLKNGAHCSPLMLEKIPQPAKPLEVTINGEKYVKENVNGY